MRRPPPLLALACLPLLAAACGGEKDKEQAGKDCTAAEPAIAVAPKLPAGFPTPTGVTFTKSENKGPSRELTGYVNGTIDDAYTAYDDALKNANGWSVTKDEKEEVDAEVNFEGGGQSGQVKLVQACKTRTGVTITFRPS